MAQKRNGPHQFWDDVDVNKTALDFHDKKARYPKEEVRKVRGYLDALLNEYVEVLERRGIVSQWTYAGSVAEGVRILYPTNTIELDVEFRIKGDGLEVAPAVQRQCGVVIKPAADHVKWSQMSFVDSEKYVSAKCVLEEFDKAFRDVLASWNSVFKQYGSVVHKTEGPAQRISISKDGREWLFVDLVPVLEVPALDVAEVRRYVAVQRPCQLIKSYFWRESFSDPEKNQYPIYEDAPYAKACLRVLKAFAIHDDLMKRLDTYVWKNLLFLALKENKGNTWEEKDVGRRVLELLARLRIALQENHLPQFFTINRKPPFSVLLSLTETNRMAMCDHLGQLLSSREKFIETFTADTTLPSLKQLTL